jgi:general secretion pathway protein M
MIVTLRDRYLGRSPREQRLLILMTAIAIPLLIWLALVVPLSSAYDRALERHLEAVDRNGRVKLLADRAKGAPDRGAPAGGDLMLVLTDSARQAGLAAEANAGAVPGSAAVSIASGPPPQVLAWLKQVEAQGYRIADVRLAPAGPGTVTLTATIARPGR